MEREMHIIRGEILDDNNRLINGVLHYPTYCGTEKLSEMTTYPSILRHPITCLGCILVRFQELAEAQDGT